MSNRTKPQAHKAVVVKSLSLSQKDWNYLKSLAIELAAKESPTADPAMLQASTSQAVRYLIDKDSARRPRDKDGNPLFGAGVGQVRTLFVSTGTTTVQSADVIDVIPLISGFGRKKGGRK